jgi:hypothetical protein
MEPSRSGNDASTDDLSRGIEADLGELGWTEKDADSSADDPDGSAAEQRTSADSV